MSRLPRKTAITIGEALVEMLKQTRLASGYNTRSIFSAWDEASGAGPYTLRKYFRNGTLYITVNSSVIASQLFFQKAALIEKMNAILAADRLFVRDDRYTGFIKDLKIK